LVYETRGSFGGGGGWCTKPRGFVIRIILVAWPGISAALPSQIFGAGRGDGVSDAGAKALLRIV
jgi:hypothetical protein